MRLTGKAVRLVLSVSTLGFSFDKGIYNIPYYISLSLPMLAMLDHIPVQLMISCLDPVPGPFAIGTPHSTVALPGLDQSIPRMHMV